MIDHVGIRVPDFAKAKAFYTAALAPLGYRVMMEFGKEQGAPGGVAGLGAEKPDFWISEAARASDPVHIAFEANDRKTVDEFYKAAIAAGGKDNGKPGLRKDYHPTYYGAFILDADGNNVEAVCHKPG